ncbi:hypothetical protein PoB_002036500 [Plakobranchus ocellatus]|uniref:Uncharacterized protein n=1 Tax=Plakobranchus ocellatus TaxID=259542 RepID=A0AAV3ZE22_9GAST|nr:hypothetical protein PoB_002036500 [Plakobranchus ocellatus]
MTKLDQRIFRSKFESCIQYPATRGTSKLEITNKVVSRFNSTNIRSTVLLFNCHSTHRKRRTRWSSLEQTLVKESVVRGSEYLLSLKSV